MNEEARPNATPQAHKNKPIREEKKGTAATTHLQQGTTGQKHPNETRPRAAAPHTRRGGSSNTGRGEQ